LITGLSAQADTMPCGNIWLDAWVLEAWWGPATHI